MSQTVNRRTFVGLLAGAVAIGAVPRLPWDTLARRLTGRLVLPGQGGYEAFARPNNLRYATTLPRAIALCENAHDVSVSILWAREHGVPLVARSGGHSYAGYSTTHGLMIDLRRMNGVSLDEKTGIVTIGGGARNADVTKALAGRRVAITHGRCPGVGVAGLALGGGIGFNMRASGLTCDGMTATEIVTADGAPHELAGDDDLFWACRGAGGGNFGIHTSFSMQAYDVGPRTVCSLTWTAQPERVFAALVKALEHAPSTIGTKVSAIAPTATAGIQVQLLAQLDGTQAQLREMLASVYAIAEPTGVIETQEYWKSQELLTEPGTPAYYTERSRFFNQAIDDRAIGTVFEWLQTYPKTAHEAAFKVFQTGERVNARGPRDMAFVHRESRWLSTIELYWEKETSADILRQNLDWLGGFYEAIVPIAKGGAYQNFIDPALADWKIAYHGANLERLEAIKKRVDPTGVFAFAESVPI
ncbi:MAG: FAD-binding oxidoreductase [Candidatus Eremiobacteraeota bacterium]|nr:FAD-binding oxidoreductase [Candidatus Eremiobacteraeota bacterium]